MPRSLRWGACILVASAIVGVIAYDYGGAPEVQRVSASSTPPLSQGSAKPALSPPSTQVDFTPPPPHANETRAQQFDRLARGTPEEALQALKLLEPCEDADFAALELAAPASDNDDPTFRSQRNAKVAAKVKALSASCEGIAAGQRTQSIPLAIKAAQAGIPGAFEALTRQEARSALGADDRGGDPRDPRIIEVMPAIWDAYVKAGNPNAILARYARVSNCPHTETCSGYDPRMALVLWTMYVDSGALKFPDSLTARWIKTLGSDVAQAAISEGHAAYANRSAK